MNTLIRFWIKAMLLELFLILLLTSCKESTIPTVNTLEVKKITQITASSGGEITSDGDASVTVRGVCWSTNVTPTIADNKTIDGTGSGSFTSSIAGLTANTTYYVRAYATNSKGTSYGSAKSFTTFNTTYTDSRDGTVYKIVTVGTQVWMAENLKYLPSVVNSDTGSTIYPCYYVYGYNGTNVNEAKARAYYTTYGVLYNYPAACNSCPDGWHLPNEAEWTNLTDYFFGEEVAGGELKESGTIHWNSPNTGATNESGFTALPGSYRNSDGSSGPIGYLGFWWSVTKSGSDYAWSRNMHFGSRNVGRNNYTNLELGLSVRCVKD